MLRAAWQETDADLHVAQVLHRGESISDATAHVDSDRAGELLAEQAEQVNLNWHQTAREGRM